MIVVIGILEDTAQSVHAVLVMDNWVLVMCLADFTSHWTTVQLLYHTEMHFVSTLLDIHQSAQGYLSFPISLSYIPYVFSLSKWLC